MKKGTFILLCMCIVFSQAVFADWNEGEPYKWYQRPDTDPVGNPLQVNGIDICVDNSASGDPPQNMQRRIGDDFECRDSDPITGVHIFGSWENDLIDNPNDGVIQRVHVMFYNDDPTGGQNPEPNPTVFSTPTGDPLYDEWFDDAQFTVREYQDITPPFYEWWWDPWNAISLTAQGDQRVWQINVDLTDKTFNQEGSSENPITYWLVIEVELDLEQSQGKSFGWKTRDRNTQVEGGGHYLDAAVWWSGGSWHDIEYPTGHPYSPDMVDMAFVLTTGDDPPPDLDFGDAPEVFANGTVTGYPTMVASGRDGARHVANGVDFLGVLEDTEPDGQPTDPADGDDINPTTADDEDGVVFANGGNLIPGTNEAITVTVSGTAGATGYLNGWVDFDQSLTWDAGEQVFTNTPVNVGTNNLTIPVPNGAVFGPTYARFRYTTYQVAAPSVSGQESDGEVEDYQVHIDEATEKLKFQQLPLDGLTIGQETYWGHDELSTVYPRYNDPIVPDDPRFVEKYLGCYMADDFADYEHSPVVRVKWWGSYLGERTEPGIPFRPQPVDRFVIAFESDMTAQGEPGQAGYIPSHPDVLLQHEVVERDVDGVLQPGEFTEKHVSFGEAACFEDLYEYETILANPFGQDPNIVYWIKIVAIVELPPDHPFWNDIAGEDMCDFLQNQYNPYQVDNPVTRWGWHNRDYSTEDTYASHPPHVIPGEHKQGILFPGTADETPVWHFQDDCVSGDANMIAAPVPYPELPFIEFVDQAKMPDQYQPDPALINNWAWRDENYKYTLPACGAPVDGPDEIAQYSKDLAFELWTTTDCITPLDTDYADWVSLGKPNSWCNQRQCHGDADGLENTFGAPPPPIVPWPKSWVTVEDLNILIAGYKDTNYVDEATDPWIAADFDRRSNTFGAPPPPIVPWPAARVTIEDLSILVGNYKATSGINQDCNQ